MPFLTGVQITFNTLEDGKDGSTMLHVFIKNRLNSSLSPERNSDFISNCLSFIRYKTDDLVDEDPNPYLAFGLNLAPGEEFEEGSSRTFDKELILRSNTISVDEIVLPVVNVHILADDDDTWIFNYDVILSFEGGVQLHFQSDVEGVRGIILDQDNRNHSGIGIENSIRSLPLPIPTKPITNAVLKKVKLEFETHKDAPKRADTRLNIHIVNRLSASSAQDIAIGLDILKGEEFPGPSHKEFTWSAGEDELASDNIRLADMVLPMVYIVIEPISVFLDKSWIFDYQVTFEFVDPNDFEEKVQVYSSRTSGIILDWGHNKHRGVYQGRPFPTVAPPTAPILTHRPIDHIAEPKVISLTFLRQKLEEFINNRNGADDSDNPPLNRIVLDNSETLRLRLSNGGVQTEPLPESFVDVSSITASKNKHLVRYISGPMSLGQLYAFECGDSFISNIKCANLSTGIDVQQPAPITFKIDFATGGGDDRIQRHIVGQAPNGEPSALSALKTYVEGAARNANNQFARLADRLDRIERAQAEPNAKLARIAEAVDRLEKERKKVMATAIAPAAAAPETTGTVPNSPSASAEGKILPNWILHGVRGRHALVENSHGDLFEITGDSSLPGLGRVEGIKRQDGQWVVVTARGLITSAP